MNVYDSATPAVKVTGKLYNGIAAYVFTSADGTVVGTAVFAEGRSTTRLLDHFTSLLHVDTNLKNSDPILVTPGNYLNEIFKHEA